ncbi:hypothetical protein P8452_45982 [Trifolium repens]|nr:hypothetical protein P8452_45982 [Trifolium repens]
MSATTKTSPSTKFTTPPSSPKPNSPHPEEVQSDMIVNATPVSMIKPSGSKKKKSKRSRRESTPIAAEEDVVPSPSTEKSKKKKKKSKKPKIGSPKRVHTMESLHVEPLPAKSGDANAEASMGALQEPNVAADVGTSLPQGEEESPAEEETAAVEEPAVIPDSPEQEFVEEDQPAEVEEPEDNTQSDKGKETVEGSDHENSNPCDKDADGDTVVVDVEGYNSDIPLKKLAEDSIARRTRSGKGPAIVESSSAATKEKKKPVKRQVMYGPKKGFSKAVVPPAKKKTQKRKEPPTSDSEYDVEQDVAHISESEEESAEEQNVELDIVHIESAVKKSYGKKKIPQGIPGIPVDLVSFHNPAHAGKWKYIAHRRSEEPFAEMEANDNYIIKAITAGKSDVTPDVGTSSSNNAMSRTDMIAALKETCKALDEKKAKLEAVIAGLELEDEQTMAEDEELEEEEPNDSEAEETDGSQDI